MVSEPLDLVGNYPRSSFVDLRDLLRPHSMNGETIREQDERTTDKTDE